MSIATPAPVTSGQPKDRVPAQTGNAEVRAALDHGIHPASAHPLRTPTGGAPEGCGDCALAVVKILTRTDPDTGSTQMAGTRLKCADAPVSRRCRQGPDLRPDTPACIQFRSRHEPHRP